MTAPSDVASMGIECALALWQARGGVIAEATPVKTSAVYVVLRASLNSDPASAGKSFTAVIVA
ncbi:MAG: hypothetical protein WAK63_12435 [Xanthobacteraceae bacterium]